MPKSSSGRSKNGSDLSSRSERKRSEDDQSHKSRSRGETTSTSSSSRNKPSQRDDDDDDDAENEGFMPNSTSFSSTSRPPHAGVAAPSVASSYATGFTREPEAYSQPPQLVRNDSMADPPRRERKESGRESKSGSKSERSRPYNDNEDRNVGRADSERSSRRESRRSSRKDSSRSVHDHTPALPQNQFPGEVPDQYTEPYRPPGQASQYYGDQGESVQSQPGVRPNPPSIIHTADQAHLMQPTSEAKPPPEPSSIGQVGAAASFFALDGNADGGGQQPTPTKPGGKPSSRPSKYNDQRTSPRSSPGPSGSLVGSMAAGAIGVGAASSATGQAAEYYTGSFSDSAPGAAAGAGLAGAAAGAYFAGHSGDHKNSSQYAQVPGPGFVVGQNQSAFPQVQQQRRQKRRGPFGKLVNWFKDPEGVAEFEAYTEAIGVCKYCFDPNSTPADAPRQHHYHQRRRSSGSRYGSTSRVDKTYRYSSSDDDKRRGSTTKKVVAGGLTGYAAMKLGEAAVKQKYDFDDTYSVKSGRPTNLSRVSFKDQDASYSVGMERRDSRRKSRGDSEKYEKRSSRRRDSSSSSASYGLSRGNALGVAAGAAGLAVGASALHNRRRSRSRSRSPTKKRKYYSKRVSPQHSYVDLTTTATGTGSIGGFFSPSSNHKKGKKQKGLFNFSNVSSSSSDADLAFGEGTVKRKPSNRRKSDRRDPNYGSTAAILGLAATGAALAAESDRTKNKGKEKRYADGMVASDPQRSSSSKIKLKDHDTTTDGENDGAWVDASDDSSSSVETALAYGRRVSASQSRESLQGTDKWDWRWNKNKEKKKEKLRRQSSSNLDLATAAAAGTGIGVTAAGMMSTDSTPKPPLQYIDPVPTMDSRTFDGQQHTVVSGGSTWPSVQFPQTSASAPLYQPQPVFPVAPVSDQFGQFERDARYRDNPNPVMDDTRPSQRDSDRRIRQRRDSSPAKLPSRENRDAVSFNLPDVAAESERLERGQSKRDEKERRKSADAAALLRNKLEDEAEQRRTSEYERREAEIEAELKKLYEEDRRRKEQREQKQDDRKRKIEVAGVAAAAAAVGAGFAAAASKSDKRSSSTDETMRRKSSMKKGKERDISPSGESQQERIARMAAQRVRSTPSPVHEDYQTFFVPSEIAEHVKEHNNESAHRDDPHVVEIIPGQRPKKKSDSFDPFHYRPFGIHPEDDPTAHPWPVPMLDLVEPTPPVSRAHSDRGEPSPMIQPVKETDEEEFGEKLERKGSKVTWGDDDVNIYEVMTPEWERSDFIPDSPEQVRKVGEDAQELRKRQINDPQVEEPPRPGVGRVYTLDDDDVAFAPSVKGAANDLPGAFPSADLHDRSASQVDIPPSEPERTNTPTIEDLNQLLQGSPFYRQPFSETVSDLGDFGGPEPNTGHGFVEEREVLETSDDVVPKEHDRPVELGEPHPPTQDSPTAPRISKSERRRLERAASLEDASPPDRIADHRDAKAVAVEEAPNTMSESKNVFDYLVDNDGKSLPPASALGIAASSVLSDGRASSIDVARDVPISRTTAEEVEEFSKPKRSFTLDDINAEETRSKSKTDYASDPEEWERSSRSKKGKQKKKSSQRDPGVDSTAALAGAAAAAGVLASAEDDFYASEKPRRGRSKRESEVFDDDDVQSVASSPATAKESDKKLRRKSKRDSELLDDEDTRSVASSPAESRKKSSREKDKEKRSSGGIWSSIFGGSKSDVSSTSKKSSKPGKSEGRTDKDRSEDAEKRKKRASNGDDLDDVKSVSSEPTRKSRRDSLPLAEQRQPVVDSRDQSVDDSFVSADEATGGKVNVNNADEQPFLVKRPDMPQPTVTHIPMATDGVSGLKAEGHLSGKPRDTAIPGVPAVVGDVLVGNEASRDLPEPLGDYATAAEATSPESRRISIIKTGEPPSSPAGNNSRRFPVSPATPRTSWSSPTPSPSSPLAAPRTRQGRPKSTEFRSGKEFRPLYLVEKSMSEKTPKTTVPEEEEILPSLPSSRTTSAHASMEDLRGEAERQNYYNTLNQMTPQQFRDRGRRHSYSYWHDEPKRRISPDYLDSRSATPVPGDAQKARDMRGRRDKPKYEFHSPSELLQDPSLNADVAEENREPPRSSSPLPSVISTDHEDFMSARSGSPSSIVDSPLLERQRSRPRSRSESSAKRDNIHAAGLGLLGGSALGLAASALLSAHEPSVEEHRELLSAEKEHAGDTIPFAVGPPPPPPPPPPSLGAADFRNMTSKRSMTEPTAKAASTERRSKPDPPKDGGLGSLAALVVQRAKQMKEDKARKVLSQNPIPESVVSASELHEVGFPLGTSRFTSDPDSVAKDVIDSSADVPVEALIEAPRAIDKGETQNPDAETAEPELTSNQTIDSTGETAFETPREELDDSAMTTKKPKTSKRKSNLKGTSETPAAALPTENTPTLEEVDSQPMTSGKKSKKDKKKAKRQDSLPPLDIGKAEARDDTGAHTMDLDDESPLTAISSERRSETGLAEPKSDAGPTGVERLPNEGPVSLTSQSEHDPRKVLLRESRDLAHFEQRSDLAGVSYDVQFDVPTNLSERASRTSFPWDDAETVSTPLPEDPERELDLHDEPLQSPSANRAPFIPPAALLNKTRNDLGAFEEAFERALRARGLPKGISREGALEGFLAKRMNAPFIAKGGLTPIEGSVASSPTDKSPPAEGEVRSELLLEPTQKLKEKRHTRKLDKEVGGSALRQMSYSGDEGKSDSLPRDSTSAEPQITVTTPDVAQEVPNPFGDDFEVRQAEVESQLPSADMQPAMAPEHVSETGRDIADKPGKVSEADSVVEETHTDVSWEDITQKDRKKKKKNQDSTHAEMLSPEEEVPVEVPLETIESARAQADDDFETPQRGKNKKKNKKKQTLDWSADVLPVAGAAVAIAAGASVAASAFEGSNDRDRREEREVSKEIAKETEQDREFERPLKEADSTSKSETLASKEDQSDVLDGLATVSTGKKAKKNKKSKPSGFDWNKAPSESITLTQDASIHPAEHDILFQTTKDLEPKETPTESFDAVEEICQPDDRSARSTFAVSYDRDTPATPKPDQGAEDELLVDSGARVTPGADSELFVERAVASTDRSIAASSPDVSALPSVPVVEDDSISQSSKKSKKDKKKAKKQATASDSFEEPPIESSTENVEVAEHGHAPFEDSIMDDIADSISKEREEILESVQEPKSITSEDAAATGATPAETPAETPTQEEDEFAWMTGRKNKKDKKKGKKRGSLLADEPETTSTTTEVTDTAREATSSDSKGLPSELATGAVVGAAASAAALDVLTRTPTETPTQEQDDFAWQPPTKKTKKDKKNRKTLTWAAEEASTPATQDGELETTVQPEESHEVAREEDVAKLAPQAEASEIMLNPEQIPIEPAGLSMRESHGIAREMFQAAQDTGPTSDIQSEKMPESLPEPASESTASPTRSDEPASMAGPSVDLTHGATEIEVQPPSVDPTPSEEPEEPSWSITTKKKSKKDKKKKRGSTFDFDSPAEAASTPELVDEVSAKEIVGGEMPLEDQIATQDRDGSAMSNKGKKGKKNGSSALTFDESVNEQENLVQQPEPEAVKNEKAQGDVKPLPIEAITEDNTKTTSKDIGEVLEAKNEAERLPIEAASTTQIPPEQISKTEGITKDATEPDHSATTRDVEVEDVEPTLPVPEPAQEWDFSTKKSKKDKKKKRTSQLAEEPSEPATPEPEFDYAPLRVVETPIDAIPADVVDPLDLRLKPEAATATGEAATDVVQSDILAATEPEAEWDFSTKKAKKDKKKKRAWQLADELSEPATPEPELQSITSPVEDSQADVVPPDATGDPDTTREPRELLGPEEAPGNKIPVDTSASADPEDDWGFSSKNSKKDKKKKRASRLADKPSEPATPEPELESKSLPTIEEGPRDTVADIEAPADAEEELIVSTKTSEKDKKKKKRNSSIVWDDSTPADRDVPKETQEPEIVAEPEKLERALGPKSVTQIAEETSQQQAEFLPEDNNRGVGVGLDSEQVSLEPIEPANALSFTVVAAEPRSEAKDATQTVEVPGETASASVLEDLNPRDEALEQPDTTSKLAEQKPEIQLKPEAETEDWDFSTKKTKKDKKKKKMEDSVLTRNVTADSAAETPAPTHTGKEAVISELAPQSESIEQLPDVEAAPAQDRATEIASVPEVMAEPERQLTPAPIFEPEVWSFSTKKSKKDKKKRKSVPGAFGDGEESGTATPDTPMEHDPSASVPMTADLPRELEAPTVDNFNGSTERTEPAILPKPAEPHAFPEETSIVEEPSSLTDTVTAASAPSGDATSEKEWSFSAKKSKKDRKKKRQSTLEDIDAGEDSSVAPTPAEAASDEPIPDALGALGGDVVEPKQDSEVTTEADAPIDWAKDPWGTSTKKTKKDKTLKQKPAFANTTSEPQDVLDPAREVSVGEPEQPSTQEKAAYLVAMAFGDRRKDRSKSPSPSRGIAANGAETSVTPADTEPNTTTTLEKPEVAPPAEADTAEDWGFTTKKSKKDKKKKRQSNIDGDREDEPATESSQDRTAETMITDAFSLPSSKHLTLEDRQKTSVPATGNQLQETKAAVDLQVPNAANSSSGPTMTKDLPALISEDEPGEDGKGRVSSRSQELSISEPELAQVQTHEDLVSESTQTDTKQSESLNRGYDWYPSSSKSKKDKKKVKRQTDFHRGEPMEEQGAENSARTTEESIKPVTFEEDGARASEGAPEEDWTVGRKKSKKEKKKKNSQMQGEGETGQPSDVAVSKTTTRELVGERAEDAEMHGRDLVLQASVLPIPEVTAAEQMSGSIPAEEPTIPGGFEAPPEAPEPPAAYESLDEGRRIPAHYDEQKPAQDDDSYPAAKKGRKSGKGKKGKPSSTFGYEETPLSVDPHSSLQATGPSGRVDENSIPSARDVTLDDSDGSHVSESTRERRKRRGSPPVYTGEELPDLPRQRSLTPPPDHDDIMDTALGVAAGIGFGDAGERPPRPKSVESSLKSPEEPSWSFANVAPAIPRELQEGNRDSAIQFESPSLGSAHPTGARDSGYVPSPATGHVWEQATNEDHRGFLRPARPQSPTSSAEDVRYIGRGTEFSEGREALETPVKRQPSPIESTTKDRSSVVFKSSPAVPSPRAPQIDTSVNSGAHRPASFHELGSSRERLRDHSESPNPRRMSDSLASNLIDRATAAEVSRSVFSPPPYSNVSGPLSPPKSPLQSIPEHRQSTSFGTGAVMAAGAVGIGAAAFLSRDGARAPSPTTSAKSLGGSKSRTSSLRNLRASAHSPSSPYDPRDFEPGSSRAPIEEVRGSASASGKAPATTSVAGGVAGMADIYDGYGHHPGTPTSPSRPPSITKRRSMQQIQDLQSRIEQLASENRMLAEAKIVAERHLEEFHLDRNRAEYATEETLRESEMKVQERDEEIEKLKLEVEDLMQRQEENSRSMGLGAGVGAAAGVAAGFVVGGGLEDKERELEELREQHRELSTGMDEIVSREIESAVAAKAAEIERLHSDLTLAQQKIKGLQAQILKERSRNSDSIIIFRDEDYFDQKCQELCQHVQGWVLRFSKFSDSRVCRSTNEVRDEKVVDRFDNAILDGSEVDSYLTDRVKRRDVFMSVVMTMIWEYVFTRYLFGMDREQRQKLKQLEKNLGEVGTKSQVGQWRAMTLTLLAKREAFSAQCETDTQAVSYEILGTLSKFLPPPANLQDQILESLRSVLRLAVNVSVEMRCQRAEYIMLPPLQPEYDPATGDLKRKVYFNASLMNERSGETNSNEELQAQNAVVRVVLFPLVVKKGEEEDGEEEEIVVCPAQVLVARMDKGKKAKRSSSQKSRVTSGRSARSAAGESTHSLGAMSGVEMESGNGNVV